MRQLIGFKSIMPLQSPDEEDLVDERTVKDVTSTEAARQEGNQALGHNINSDGLSRSERESSASSTAREQTLGTATRRLERALTRDGSFDLEAQDPEDCEP